MRSYTSIRIDDPLPAATLLRVAPRRHTFFVVVVLRQEHAALPVKDRGTRPVGLEVPHEVLDGARPAVGHHLVVPGHDVVVRAGHRDHARM